MNKIRIIVIFFLVCFFAVYLSSCGKKLSEGVIVFTQVSGKSEGNSGNKIQARIVALDPDKSGSQPEELTNGFYSARSPVISCEGTTMLFSAQKNENDKWQIWEMDLGTLKTRQIIILPEDCIDPAYLPDGRVIFSKERIKDDLNSGFIIVSCNSDGSDMRQLTFNPYNYSASTVLKDGRLLAISRALDPEQGDAVYMVLRPDGTKNELFYKGSSGNIPSTRGWETSSGRIVFVGSDKGKTDCGGLTSISYNRPLHTCINLSAEIQGDFNSVFPLKSGKFLVSYRKSESEKYGLYQFDPESKTLGQAVYNDDKFEVAEIVAVVKQERPKKLPSEVDMGVKTGLLLCQDVAFQDINTSVTGLPGVKKIRISGKDSTLGEIDTEKDGSFFLKVIADTPFQIQAIDDKGNVIGKPCGWIYLRPNERRGCVGCHEDHELVPDNKVPLAVKFAPVNIPVHINKVVEKKVSLE